MDKAGQFALKELRGLGKYCRSKLYFVTTEAAIFLWSDHFGWRKCTNDAKKFTQKNVHIFNSIQDCKDMHSNRKNKESLSPKRCF